jgi:hypothetical protein
MTLTGQDIGEAEAAAGALLATILAPTGVTRAEYIALRLLSARGPFESAAAVRGFLASQPQLGLDETAADALLADLTTRGLVADQTRLTEQGEELNSDLLTRIAPATRRMFEGVDPADLDTAHRVLVEVTRRARNIVESLNS